MQAHPHSNILSAILRWTLSSLGQHQVTVTPPACNSLPLLLGNSAFVLQFFLFQPRVPRTGAHGLGQGCHLLPLPPHLHCPRPVSRKPDPDLCRRASSVRATPGALDGCSPTSAQNNGAVVALEMDTALPNPAQRHPGFLWQP